MRYSDELRQRVVAEVIPPKNRTVVEVCEEHKTWTHRVGRHKRRFETPLRQNCGHINAVKATVPEVPVTGLVVFMDRARFPKGLPEGVTTLSLLQQALPLTNAESTHVAHREARDTVMSHILTDRLSRDALLVMVRRRKRRW